MDKDPFLVYTCDSLQTKLDKKYWNTPVLSNEAEKLSTKPTRWIFDLNV